MRHFAIVMGSLLDQIDYSLIIVVQRYDMKYCKRGQYVLEARASAANAARAVIAPVGCNLRLCSDRNCRIPAVYAPFRIDLTTEPDKIAKNHLAGMGTIAFRTTERNLERIDAETIEIMMQI